MNSFFKKTDITGITTDVKAHAQYFPYNSSVHCVHFTTKSKTMNKTVFGLIICIVMLGACSKSNTNPGYTPDCTGATKSYSTDVLPVFQTSCNGCHSNFSSYAQISADKAYIRSKIVDGSMPKSGSLSTTQKNNVVCWIDNGAPNN